MDLITQNLDTVVLWGSVFPFVGLRSRSSGPGDHDAEL